MSSVCQPTHGMLRHKTTRLSKELPTLHEGKLSLAVGIVPSLHHTTIAYMLGYMYTPPTNKHPVFGQVESQNMLGMMSPSALTPFDKPSQGYQEFLCPFRLRE